jgi:energy-coupling factor transport system ATP-binding protein
VVLLADGRPIADGPPHEILAGGTYFATEVARILNGVALTAAEGVGLLTNQPLPV